MVIHSLLLILRTHTEKEWQNIISQSHTNLLNGDLFHFKMLLLKLNERLVSPDHFPAQGWGREADTSCILQHNTFFIATLWTQARKETILKHVLVQSSQGEGCDSRLLLTFEPAMLHSHYCSACWIDTLLATHTRTRAHTRCALHHVPRC